MESAFSNHWYFYRFRSLLTALGAIDYITKPFSPDLVLLRVKNHMKFKQMSDRFRDMATMDGLTGIANRRRFDLFLEQEWSRSMRAQAPLSLILMDIDFFKPFNDNYGHAEGDECLKKVAQALASCMTRTTDLVARYGGEEFVCVLPETDATGAVKLGEELRKSVSDLKYPHEHSKANDHVTISLGAITVIPELDKKLEDLIPSADKNLYLVPVHKQGILADSMRLKRKLP